LEKEVKAGQEENRKTKEGVIIHMLMI